MYQLDAQARRPAELGPESLLWRWAGDTRIGLLAGPVGLLQTMHPAIGAALVDHSDFFTDPANRVVRSLPPILGSVYDGPDEGTGKAVRDYHRDIKGHDAKGRRYHALDPGTYWWAHATFQYMVEQVADRFERRPLTPYEREQLYQEGVAWYLRYGVSDRCVPETRAAFQQQWDYYCEEVLEPNPAANWLLDGLAGRQLAPISTLPPPIPKWVVPATNVKLLRRIALPSGRVVVYGGLPPRVRERFGLRWTRVHELRLSALDAAVRRTWHKLPQWIRWQPRARAGWQRVGRTPPR
ncbi:MAG: oxygenase MpaB family protein [Acidimicrobiales bacterium]